MPARGADARVRQNLGLVVGLQGRFAEAESIVKADLPPEEAAANVAYLKEMLSRKDDPRRPVDRRRSTVRTDGARVITRQRVTGNPHPMQNAEARRLGSPGQAARRRVQCDGCAAAVTASPRP